MASARSARRRCPENIGFHIAHIMGAVCLMVLLHPPPLFVGTAALARIPNRIHTSILINSVRNVKSAKIAAEQARNFGTTGGSMAISFPSTSLEQDQPIIKVWKIEEDWHPYSWRFSVTFQGRTHQFAGVPNYCETKRSASCRARWRAKWLLNGTFDRRYSGVCFPG